MNDIVDPAAAANVPPLAKGTPIAAPALAAPPLAAPHLAPAVPPLPGAPLAPAPPEDGKPSYILDVRLHPSPADPRSLVFAPMPGAPVRPDELSVLMGQYAEVARTAGTLLEDDLDQRQSLLGLIQNSARATLCGSGYNLSDARAGIGEAQQQVTDAAVTTRARRLKSYNNFLVGAGFIPCLLGLAFYRTNGFGLNPQLTAAYAGLWGLGATALLIAGGATICVWAEFVLRVHEPLTYDKVTTLDLGRWLPSQRVGITIVISFIFAYLLAFNVVQIGLGGVLLNDFTSKTPELALAVGGITGLAFSAVRDIIYRVKPEEKK